ncbi:oxidoreductase, FAD-binding [Oceanicola granulosus HTCC2516]|uniref:Oxidoreductase, FAD-binding n=1 Tax=Oceanicola granulosus (strain ATCC BAA-861 / DSM 15982 / KCTC 12143 / HTCC2516) TaxID=314256 RepID=Q2CAC7_OCEGH|nr:FAD-binding oxidoreductase [Oceanicola granulosus]EAR49640.1 oxidoreductase, FAD-binding [Oceanicola granulosus HTCC2516]
MPLTSVSDAVLAPLREALPAAAFRETTDSYLTEPRGRYRGRGTVIAPGSTEEVAAVVRACAAASVPVVPYGGGTGLVGGQVMSGDVAPVILSLERMTRVRGLWPDEGVIEVDAGCILADVQAAAADAGRLFPLSLASEGSARLGGLLATNAGGLNVLRYGNARAQCLGLEAVLADGTVWNGLSRLRKDNTGYDLRDLLIGSEGTLGIITAASLRLMPRPAAEGVAILAVESPAAALSLLALAQARVGEALSAFELIHRQGPDFLAEVGPEVRMPFAGMPEWMVLVEVGLPAGLSPADALEALFADALEAGLSDDGVIAQSEAQRAEFWALREAIPEANRRIGSISSHDISVPLSEVPAFIRAGAERLAPLGDIRINCFGHLGDGNLHYNAFPARGRSRDEYADIRETVKRTVHDLAHELGGSVSAEHGIGRLKVGDLARYGDPAKLAMMRAIKHALDPAGILNPGAMLGALTAS